MANSKDVLALNGKIYDVTTGTLVNSIMPAKSLPQPRKFKKTAVKSIVDSPTIDGFMSPSPTIKATSAKHQTARHAVRHKPEHAKTLVRGTTKPNNHSSLLHSRTGNRTLPQTDTTRKESARKDDIDRNKRSKAIGKSSLINRFSHITAGQVIKKIEHLEVKKPKKETAENLPSNRSAMSNNVKSEETTIGAASNLFTKALVNATSHKEPSIKSTVRRRTLAKKLGLASRTSKILAVILVVLSILSAGVWFYLPNIQMRIASMRAGVNAALPSYQPSGFTQKNVDYKQGQVTLLYKSNSDGRNFSIQQTASRWDSETLLNSYITPARWPYQTYQDQGKTIYIYNSSDATWVSGGVWYKIEGNSNLNSDQLLRIANSL